MEYQEINKAKRIEIEKQEIALRDEEYGKYRKFWYKSDRKNYLPLYPLHVDIELSNACNLRCKMCQHGMGLVKNAGFMDDNLVRRLIDECREIGVYSIKFNWRGEVTLNPFLPKAISYAKNNDILEVQINTNGLPSKRDMLIECAESGIDRIIFSVDGFSKNTYESIRTGGNYEQLLENIHALLDWKKVNNSRKPFIRIQMIRANINAYEVDDYIEYWQALVDDVRISDVTNRGQGEGLSVGDQKITGRRRCPQPFQRLVIARDGRVSPCCMDWSQDYIVGNVCKDTLLDIWKNERMNHIRDIQNRNEHHRIKICKTCSVKESYTWEKI